MSEKATEVVRTGLAVGGLGITYQAALIDGKTLAFETAVDQTMDREELDDYLDTFIGAAKRQQAIEELPLVKQNLATNLAMLRNDEKERAKAIARIEARSTIVSGTRRNPRPPSEGDQNNLAQFEQRIARTKAAINAARARIPYLEAIIARQTPPEPFPQPERDEEEAAAAA